MNRLAQLELLDRATAALSKRRQRVVAKGAGRSRELTAVDEAIAEVSKARDAITSQLGLQRGTILGEIRAAERAHGTRQERAGMTPAHPHGR